MQTDATTKQDQPLLSDHVDMRLVAADPDQLIADRNTIVQLDPDHPGFRDLEYRRRRNQIAQIAMEYQPGDPIPDAPYTDEEHQEWDRRGDTSARFARSGCAGGDTPGLESPDDRDRVGRSHSDRKCVHPDRQRPGACRRDRKVAVDLV